MLSETCFFVEDRAAFPKPFIPSLGLDPDQLLIFLTYHADLLAPEDWRDAKRRHEASELSQILPLPGEPVGGSASGLNMLVTGSSLLATALME
jgi:hypothetical protein